MASKRKHISVFKTEQGVGGVVTGELGVVEVILPFGASVAAEVIRGLAAKYGITATENDISRAAAAALAGYFSGSAVDLAVPIEMETTPFRQRVYEAVRAIPLGQVRTYSEIAAAVGSPGAARGVGGAMAANPVPILIPCHRVVGAGGNLTGFSAAGGVASKKWLLEMEAGLLRKAEHMP